MATTTTQATFRAVRDAIENRDLDAFLDTLADEAVLIGYDQRNPPASPLRIEGKAAIGEMLRDVYGREMKHEIRDEVVGDDRFSFNEWCEYPDGNRVIASQVFEVRDGRIMQTILNQTWDE
jgi:ketosteroid isomerase-like protein